jgi:transcription elongation factor Elf1
MTWCPNCQINTSSIIDIHVSSHTKITSIICSNCNLTLEEKVSEHIPEKYLKKQS